MSQLPAANKYNIKAAQLMLPLAKTFSDNAFQSVASGRPAQGFFGNHKTKASSYLPIFHGK
jgi:hypothetical protein